MNSQKSTSEGMDLTKSQRKTLESLGHVWTKFHQAQQLLLKRSAKGQLSESLAAWLDFDPERLAVENPFEPSFMLRVQEVETAGGSLIYSKPIGISQQRELASIEPYFTGGLPNEINLVPDIMNAPVWSALLRLNELKTFWIQELRQNHYDALLQWLPDRWLYIQTELPPGTTIARLGKRDWSTVLESSERFVRLEAHELGTSVPLELKSLADAQAGKHVFERVEESVSRELVVLYYLQNGKTQLGSAISL